jgi:hypothetical protein
MAYMYMCASLGAQDLVSLAATNAPQHDVSDLARALSSHRRRGAAAVTRAACIDLAAQYAIASMYCEHGTGQNVRFISRNRGC